MSHGNSLRFYGSINSSSQEIPNEHDKTPDCFEDETVFYYESDESLDSLERIQPCYAPQPLDKHLINQPPPKIC